MTVKVPRWLEAVRVLIGSGPDYNQNAKFEEDFAKALSPNADFVYVYRTFVPWLHCRYMLPLDDRPDTRNLRLNIIQGVKMDWCGPESLAHRSVESELLYSYAKIASKCCVSDSDTFIDYPADLVNEAVDCAAKTATKDCLDAPDSANRYEIASEATEKAFREITIYLLDTLYRAVRVY